jgi:endonuclease YncB( thermonuclease family)
VEGPRIRLHGIAAREVRRVRGRIVDAGCKRGHPCGEVTGVVARDRLMALLGGPRGALPTGHVRVRAATLRCHSYGSGKAGRTAANCTLPGVGDLSCAMVRSGAALRWREYGGARVCR